MGTRNLTLVKLHGELKVAQYGQWDGYPTGQGEKIAEFLREKLAKKGLAEFAEKVDRLYFGTDKAIEKLCDGDGWAEKHPEFSRDTCALILKLVDEGKVKFVADNRAFLEDGTFCEWAYEVDLTTETVVVFRGGTKWKVLTFKEFAKRGAMEKLQDESNKESE